MDENKCFVQMNSMNSRSKHAHRVFSLLADAPSSQKTLPSQVWILVWLWVLGLFLFVFSWFGCLLVWLCLGFACAPYAPSYISYDDSSHSEWALVFLLGRSTSGVACFTPS